MIVIFFTIDKIIGDIAVLMTDDEKIHEVKVTDIPFELDEGDVLTGEIIDEKIIITAKDINEKSIRSERINILFEKLKTKNRSDDK